MLLIDNVIMYYQHNIIHIIWAILDINGTCSVWTVEKFIVDICYWLIILLLYY